MNETRMLHEMCHHILSSADIAAIGHERGLMQREIATPSLLESIYLSEIGVRQAMDSCSDEQVAALHMLRFLNATVDVSFFVRIKPTQKARPFGTFNQKYQDLWKHLQTALLRKGLLLIYEDNSAVNATSKLERIRLRLPSSFEALLPPLIHSARQLPGAGEINAAVLRSKLAQVFNPPASPNQYTCHIVQNTLMIGNQPFRLERLKEWQRVNLETELGNRPEPVQGATDHRQITRIEVIEYILRQLGRDQWLSSEQMDRALRIFLNSPVTEGQVCQAGWRWGYLACQKVDGEIWYRPAVLQADDLPSEPKACLRPADGHEWIVDLEEIPYAELETLAQTMNMRIQDGQLRIASNRIRLGDAFETARHAAVLHWLRPRMASLEADWQAVEQNWGRRIVHQNLLVARISDLSLQVQIARALDKSPGLVVLSNEWIAFVPELMDWVSRIVAQNGYVIREVQAP